MLYNLECTCGRPIEFMEYIIIHGLTSLIKVGCPDCLIMFYLEASKYDVPEIPKMNQLDWLTLLNKGKVSTKGKCKEMTNALQMAF